MRVKNLGAAWLSGSNLRFPMKLQEGVRWGYIHSKAWLGLKAVLRGGHGCQVCPGYRWESSVPLHVGLSTGLLNVLTVTTDCPECAIQETKQMLHCPCDPALEVRQCDFCHILLVTQTYPDSMWKQSKQGYEYHEVRNVGAILEAGTTFWP